MSTEGTSTSTSVRLWSIIFYIFPPTTLIRESKQSLVPLSAPRRPRIPDSQHHDRERKGQAYIEYPLPVHIAAEGDLAEELSGEKSLQGSSVKVEASLNTCCER